jgi:tetratricopeptide (TPR) repeat protein
MFFRVLKPSLDFLLIACNVLVPAAAFAQQPVTDREISDMDLASAARAPENIPTIDIDIHVKGPNSIPVEGMAVITLTTMTGQFYRQGTTKAGYLRFDGVAPTQYTIQVMASGFETAVEEFNAQGIGPAMVGIELRPISEEETTDSRGLAVLAPKAQKELGKALEALRAKKPGEARSHLDAAYRLAPNHPEVNYLFGVYERQLNEWGLAKAWWAKVLEVNPKHFQTLLSLSEMLLGEKSPAEAEVYLNRAVEAEPSSWRAHAILADVLLQRGVPAEAVKQAERAMELGHGQAATVQPLLARALLERGDKERAVCVLQAYLQDHPGDVAAKKQFESLQAPLVLPPPDAVPAAAQATPSAVTVEVTSLPLPSSWLPPDVDEKVPSVEAGAVCALDEVLQHAGKKMQEFVSNVDRFTATESLKHESINKWGFPSSPETRKFDYVVSIEEARPGFLNVEEYRSSRSPLPEFPDGVATHGLPAMALIFHPYNSGNFHMTCEGLTHWNGALAWQVHFRQRTDRPNTMRAYKLGINGPSYPVGLRGRAWIAADSYQVVRLETDLIAPLPEIRLVADHTAIEYGPVHFRARKVDMWLPRSAEVYYDWRGRRSHRRHSFSNYLLFSVDDQQRIFMPKFDEASASDSSGDARKPNP